MIDLNYDKLYNVENPFEWMDIINIKTQKSNFFERKVNEYKKNLNETHVFNTNTDF